VVRLISGVVMAAVALAAMVWLPPTAFRAAVSVLAAAAAFEYAALAGRGAGTGRWVVVVLVALSAWAFAEGPIWAGTFALAVLTAAAAAVLGQGRSIPSSLAAVFGVVYLGIPLGLLTGLRGSSGWRVAVLLVATVVVSDSLQYYSGRLFGRRPLAPRVSPKKTVEGAVGGVVAAAFFLGAAGPLFLPGSSRAGLAALGLAVALLGICGDLFESQLKRGAGMKDSSHVIPGHGGVLDRVDALLFAIPAFHVYVRGGI
jgi:phosphatidate cytidylyltransferase